MNEVLNIVHVDAVDLPDSWFQLVSKVLTIGREFVIDRGSFADEKRLEFDYVTARIAQPWLRDTDGWPLIPVMPEGSTIPAPVSKEYLVDYAPYIMTANRHENEQYTYGQRLWAMKHEDVIINQVERVINTYKEHGHRNNQMVLQVGHPSDLLLSDPSCLRHIDTRIQDNKLHFFIYFRSWDLWGGYPANLALLSVLQEYMASEIGVDPGEFVVSSKGLHLYKYVEELAKMRCGVV